jgi:protein-S-isoprenylcysteine O-methyltransferase Ste14
MAKGFFAANRLQAVKHLRAILLLPFMVTVVIPTTILWRTGLDTFGIWHSVPATRVGLPIIGGALICVGLVLMVLTNRLFITVGKGTLAPWNPTQHLVVQGVYRHVRNPMISGVMAILFGETICTVSLPLACWFLFFVTVNVVFIPLAEEPGLVNRFGNEYEEYRRNVPRWIPRLKPWEGD